MRTKRYKMHRDFLHNMWVDWKPPMASWVHHPWDCERCVSNLLGFTNYPRHRGLGYQGRDYMESIMKRPTEAQAKTAKQMGTADKEWHKKYPTITTYLLDEKWDDGKAREVSGLALTIKDGLWQVALNDKDLKQSVYTSAATIEEALELMEAALRDGKAPWRSWKRGK